MAGPITHIILALKMFTCGLLDSNTVDMKLFLLGTSFPDIRYLGVIERTTTHSKNISWLDVVNEPSPFLAGLKFHALVDELRETFLEDHGMYNLIPKRPYLSQCMKFVEDGFLYHKINEWDSIITVFDTISSEEKAFNIADADVKRWHTILKKYCAEQPQKNLIIHMIRTLSKVTYKLSDIEFLIAELEQESEFQKLIETFYDSFETLLN